MFQDMRTASRTALLLSFLLGACAPKQGAEPAREPVTKKDPESESEQEPVEAPPPGYGNKVVETDPEEPEQHASDRPDGQCRVPKRKSEAGDEAEPVECVHSTTLVQ
jgi:hypothetical protein